MFKKIIIGFLALCFLNLGIVTNVFAGIENMSEDDVKGLKTFCDLIEKFGSDHAKMKAPNLVKLLRDYTFTADNEVSDQIPSNVENCATGISIRTNESTPEVLIINVYDKFICVQFGFNPTLRTFARLQSWRQFC
ncbi:MAG: hypothetical protein LBJ83_03230 [Oscillospiraceae bacterium]|jgi:hypothetical protein|nr:hypothetical protein [Oscillospiraceae bacterium]